MAIFLWGVVTTSVSRFIDDQQPRQARKARSRRALPWVLTRLPCYPECHEGRHRTEMLLTQGLDTVVIRGLAPLENAVRHDLNA